MARSIPDARKALIDRIARTVARKRSKRGVETVDAAFLHAYFRGVGEDDLAEREPRDLAAAASCHRAIAKVRSGGRIVVRAFNPDVAQDGFSSAHTVVAIVCDDMPFLVDSVGLVFTRAQIAVHLVVHPVLYVRRDARGRLLDVADAPADRYRAESWQFYEIDRQDDATQLRQLEQDITASLADVRAAVVDWAATRARVREIAASLDAPVPHLAPADRAEAKSLLHWMDDQHFVFLGYRHYRLARGARTDKLVPDASTGLGILRTGHRGVRPRPTPLQDELRTRARERVPLILTKANSLSTVHRGTYLDYVGVKTFDARGDVTGEHRFLGLWTSSVYFRSAREIPVLRRKVVQVIDHFALEPQSHDAKACLSVLESYPRDELFQASVEDLVRIVRGVVNLYERRTVRLLCRRDPYGRFYSCLVYVPRDRYSTEVRQRIESLLKAGFHGQSLETQVQISDSHHARVHVVVRIERGSRERVDIRGLERAIGRAAMDWSDHLRLALLAHYDESSALALAQRYATTFPAAYQEDVEPHDTIEDLVDLESLVELPDAVRLNLYRPAAQVASRLHLKLTKRGDTIPISDMMPLLENFGLRVISERPYELAWPDGGTAWIQDLELQHRDGAVVDISKIEEPFKDAVLRTWRGEVENDGFNRLTIAAQLTAREIVILRAVCKYLLQTGVPFSQASMERALSSQTEIARHLVQLFVAQFDPALPSKRREVDAERNISAIRNGLDKVTSLDDDRILRAFLAVIRASLRTNYFRTDEIPGAPEAARDYVSIKLDPAKIPDLPLPRPKFEIFVYSPRVEGVHLRMGFVARGGLRWSDRRDDFRTEVLGLMKAQNVKNTLIVPVGAKGGFVPKRLPLAGSRDQIQQEVVASYRTFIRGLLDVTDNIVNGRIVAPRSVVRRDGDDAYLVVAADKGTATFSDIANGISIDYGFWLGDAFASGGSAGYDHKKMGITARGAWECVKRHFRELDHDIQKKPFTVAGIGDMSGDVFGNGMLLSKQIRLVAAFNHQHVFIDPEPDLAKSFAERQRLFLLPRSSWADYDRRLISAGGGIYERSAKSIALSAAAKRLLQIDTDAPTPQDVVKAILRMPVDLLWNGGIGTYVKANYERQSEAGDRSNDGVRVDGRELRARVVGEGGNLGFTQRGRIEYALAGGRMNTDFIDNSAGVNTSDVEVNIKILLSEPERRGRVSRKDRNVLLRKMTRDVAALVLRNNYLQSQALSTLAVNATERIAEYRELVRALERSGELNRVIEFLPSDDEFVERRKRGLGLSRPELAVVLAYSKIWLSTALLESDVAKDPYLSAELQRYFPQPLHRRFARDIERHRLRNEIIVTATTNSLVNRMGPVFAWRATEETGADPAQVARAYTIARETFEMRDTWSAIEKLDNRVPAATQYQAMARTARLLRHMTYWLLAHRRRELHVDKTVAEFQPGVRTLAKSFDRIVSEAARAKIAHSERELTEAGMPAALAARIASLEAMESAFDVVELAAAHKVGVEDVARLHFALGSDVGLEWIRDQISSLAVEGPWQASARSGLRDSASATHRAIVERILSGKRVGDAAARVKAWTESVGDEYAQWARTLTDMRAAGRPDFATLSVGAEAIRRLTLP